MRRGGVMPMDKLLTVKSRARGAGVAVCLYAESRRAFFSFPLHYTCIDATKKGRRQLFAVFLIGNVWPAASESLKS